jgi:hypothetical protein
MTTTPFDLTLCVCTDQCLEDDCPVCSVIDPELPCPRADEEGELHQPNLPAPLGDAAGHLDVDRLRELAPAVRTGLIAELRNAATAVRAGRGTVVVPEDTYDLVRRTTAAAEVLRQWRDAFEAAAKEADAICEEEALTAIGGLPGYEEAPAGSLFVPDGAGQRIAVTPDWKAGESTWDVTTLVNWLIADEISDVQAAIDDQTSPGADGRWTRDDARAVAQNATARLLALGTFSPGIKKLDALRKKLSELGRDSDAAVIRQVRSVGLRQYRGVKISREEVK